MMEWKDGKERERERQRERQREKERERCISTRSLLCSTFISIVKSSSQMVRCGVLPSGCLRWHWCCSLSVSTQYGMKEQPKVCFSLCMIVSFWSVCVQVPASRPGREDPGYSSERVQHGGQSGTDPPEQHGRRQRYNVITLTLRTRLLLCNTYRTAHVLFTSLRWPKPYFLWTLSFPARFQQLWRQLWWMAN